MPIYQEKRIMNLFEKLEEKKRKHKIEKVEEIVQIKIDSNLKEKLAAKLDADGLTYKDLFLSTIEIYLGL